MTYRILALFFAAIAAICIAFGLAPKRTAQADEGCPAGLTARATLIYGNTSYKTCYRTSCSGYSPAWTKYVTHLSTAIPPVLIVDAEYKIQGGNMTGIPACRPEISDNAGWTQ